MFNQISKDLTINISHYLNIFDIISFYSTSTYFLQFKNLEQIQVQIDNAKEKFQFIKKQFYHVVIDLMGGIKTMMLFPILKWDDKFIGCSGYIDKIYPNDMTSPIMIGFDEFYKRPFIAIRIKQNNRNIYLKNKVNVTCLFQRYGDSRYSWSEGSVGFSFNREAGYFIDKGKLVHKLLKKNIENLINNKGHLLYYSHYSDKEILKDEESYLV